jgi:hypothetical protein
MAMLVAPIPGLSKLKLRVDLAACTLQASPTRSSSHGYEFEHQAVFNQNIKAKPLLENRFLVFDLNNALIDGRQLAENMTEYFRRKRRERRTNQMSGKGDRHSDRVTHWENWLAESCLKASGLEAV